MMNRRAISFILVLAMVITPVFSFAATGSYKDTAGHWAESSINRWSKYNIVAGYDGSFLPDDYMTRGQLAKVISNMLGLTEMPDSNPFSDLDLNAWYAPFVLRCYKAGIMLGSNGKANPEDTVTRQEAMTMIARALEIKPIATSALSKYSDASSVEDWASGYMAALIEKGVVGGVTKTTLAPVLNIDRASVMTVFDRAVAQYINEPGTYTLEDKAGIILVASGDVTLTGSTKADILVTSAAKDKAITFDKATVTGSITVPESSTVNNNGSTLPNITAKADSAKPAAAVAAGGGGGGGTSGYSPSVAPDATIDTSSGNANSALAAGTYNNVTITEAVGDGTVLLQNVTINGDLIINGGGSSSVILDLCRILGRIIFGKTTNDGTESTRIYLMGGTDANNVEVNGNAGLIIESETSESTIGSITASNDLEIRGSNTNVNKIVIPENITTTVAVNVSGGSVDTIQANSETIISGSSGNVGNVNASANVTAGSLVVDKVTLPESATTQVAVSITGNGTIEVEANNTYGANLTAENATNVTLSTTNASSTGAVTMNGNAIAHIHVWDAGTVTRPATCTQTGIMTYKCTADGCTYPVAEKTEDIPLAAHDLEHHDAIEYTATTDGNIEYWACANCGKLFSDAKAQHEISDGEQYVHTPYSITNIRFEVDPSDGLPALPGIMMVRHRFILRFTHRF